MPVSLPEVQQIDNNVKTYTKSDIRDCRAKPIILKIVYQPSLHQCNFTDIAKTNFIKLKFMIMNVRYSVS